MLALKAAQALRLIMRVRQIQQRLSLPGRYATSLYLEALEIGQVEAISQDISHFQELLTSTPELATLLKGELLRPKIAIAILYDVSKIVKFSETFLKFLTVVANNRRLKFLAEIFSAFTAILNDAANTVPVKIEMVKITNEHKDTIEKLLATKYPNQTLKYNYSQVPELLGGFRAFINEQCLDYSLISRLNRLRSQLKEA
jgi:ATP synthase F1 delta subunit